MKKNTTTKTPLTYAELEFDAVGTPHSPLYNDVYFSSGQGVAESRYVFLQHNNLPAQWQTLEPHRTWVIAETGFGTGLNFYLTATEFLAHAPEHSTLHFISFEKHPLSPASLKEAARRWPEFKAISDATLQHYPNLLPGLHRLQLHPRITLDLVYGDALDTVPDWAALHSNTVNSWFLDGFAPSKNPSMWQPILYRAVFNSLKANGTLATFTATGHVRRGLEAAGLTIKKAPGFGGKRNMLCGSKRTLGMPTSRQPKSIAIIGGGIAAACVAMELRDFPGQLRLIWAAEHAADAASGNPQAAMYPRLQAHWDVSSEFYAHAFCFSHKFYQQHVPQHVHWTGVELLERSIADRVRHKKIISRQLYPASLLEEKTNSLFMPNAGWLNPFALVTDLFQQLISYRLQQGLPVELVKHQQVKELHRDFNQWKIKTKQTTYRADHVVLCVGHSIHTHSKFQSQPMIKPVITSPALTQAHLPIRPIRGQITLLKQGELSNLKHVMCEHGYVLPPHKGMLCTGATFDKEDPIPRVKASDNEVNIAQLNSMLDTQFTTAQVIASRASVRSTTPDHLPIQGLLARASTCGNKTVHYAGLSVLLGLGSRGFTTAPWLAHGLVGEIMGTPRLFGQRLNHATGPSRFIKRDQTKTS